MTATPAEAARILAVRERLLGDQRETARALDAARRRSALFESGRLIAFVLILGAFIAAGFAEDKTPGRTLLPVAIGVFVVLVLAHGPVQRQRDRLERRRDLLLAKNRRFDGEPLQDLCRPPRRLTALAPSTHATRPLAPHVRADLAVSEGPLHLAGVLDASASPLGSSRLAEWLERPALDAAEIRARQAAAQAIFAAPAAGFAMKEEFAAAARVDFDRLLKDALAIPGEPPVLRRIGLFGIGGATAVGAVFTVAVIQQSDVLALVAALVAALLNFLLRKPLKRAVELRARLLEDEGALAALAPLAAALGPVAAGERLRHLGQRLEAPLASIAALTRILAFAKVHKLGLIYVAFNLFTFYDLWWLAPLDRAWRKTAKALPDAVAAAADLEALLALAEYRETRADTIWPEALDGPRPVLEIEEARHPLLDFATAVPNSVRLGDPVRLLVVTGSNMSGKSTYLKAAGLALLAAEIGAPVRARAMRFTPMGIVADINVRDALESGESYFAVEARRIRDILAETAAEPRTLVLLDEIFRGTNTREKVAAGLETALHLSRTGAPVILATHDHEFTGLADEAAPVIANAHFEDTVEDGEMVFPYRIREGRARTTNALRVLRTRGFPKSLVDAAELRLERGNQKP